MIMMFNPQMGKTRFNELLECAITLKETIDTEGKKIKYTEMVKRTQNNKVDLFTKFIGLDRNPLPCEFVLLYNQLSYDMKQLQFISVITKHQSLKLFDIFPKKARIH